MANFGVRFRVLRRESGLSQQKVAEALGLSQSTVAAWETGRSVPDVDTAEKAAKVLGVSMEHFFGDGPADKSAADLAYEVLDILSEGRQPPESLYSEVLKELRYLGDEQLTRALSYIRFLKTEKPSSE